MDKVLVRITIVIIASYLFISYLVAQFIGIDILNDWYNIMFELCVVVSTFSYGSFHCKYMRFTALSLFLSDLITRLDNSFNFLSITAHNLIPIGILAMGICTSLALALHHFYKVNKLQNERRKNRINNG